MEKEEIDIEKMVYMFHGDEFRLLTNVTKKYKSILDAVSCPILNKNIINLIEIEKLKDLKIDRDILIAK